MAKKQNIKVKRGKAKTASKNSKLKEIASILTWITIILLLFQGIYALILKDKLIAQLDAQSISDLQTIGISLQAIGTAILVIGIVWIVFGIVIFFLKKGIEKGKIKWWWLLAISIVALFTGRVESAILGIIASILYAKSK